MSMIGNTNKKAVSDVVRTCRSAFGAVFTVSAVLNILMLTGPLFMLQVYDRVLASNSVPTLVVLGGIALALYMFSGFLEVLRLRALNRISMRVYTKLSGPAFRANIQMPMLLGRKASRCSAQSGHRRYQTISRIAWPGRDLRPTIYAVLFSHYSSCSTPGLAYWL